MRSSKSMSSPPPCLSLASGELKNKVEHGESVSSSGHAMSVTDAFASHNGHGNCGSSYSSHAPYAVGGNSSHQSTHQLHKAHQSYPTDHHATLHSPNSIYDEIPQSPGFYYQDDTRYECYDGDVEMSDSDGGALRHEEGIDDIEEKFLAEEEDENIHPVSWGSNGWSTPATSYTSDLYSYYGSSHVGMHQEQSTAMSSPLPAVTINDGDGQHLDAPPPAMPPPPPHADLVHYSSSPSLQQQQQQHHASGSSPSPLSLSPHNPVHSSSHLSVPSVFGPHIVPQSHAYGSHANHSYAYQSLHAGTFVQHLQELQQQDADQQQLEALAASNPNPNMLGPPNHGLVMFLQNWASPNRYMNSERSTTENSRPRAKAPSPLRVEQLADTKMTRVEYHDLEGDSCDFQGINWKILGVTRREARNRRNYAWRNFVNVPNSDDFEYDPSRFQSCKPGESYFRFRRMDIRSNVHLAHFQLRSLLGSTSRSQSFYPSRDGVVQINPMSGTTKTAIDITKVNGESTLNFVSTLAAGHGLLVAATMGGEYYLRHLETDYHTWPIEGKITDHHSGITTHAKVEEARTSSRAQVAFLSNDNYLRILDVENQKWHLEKRYSGPANCLATSPDRRLRAIVGDYTTVLITNAETGEILETLEGHKDFGFACDWAQDGWQLATGFQDREIKIWDSRMWKDRRGNATPLRTLRTEMAGVRNLKFSPLGSGKNVLVAAEESDHIHIIDASDFSKRQTIDVFSEIGGVDFANDGRSLQILCCDQNRGGLLQLERCELEDESVVEVFDSIEIRRRGVSSRYYKPQRLSGDVEDLVERRPRRQGPGRQFDDLGIL